MSRLPASFLAFFFSASIAIAETPQPTASHPSSELDPDTVVATVGDRELTLGELFIRFATLPQFVRDRYGGQLDEFLRDTVVDLLRVEEALSLGAADDPLYEVLMRIRRDEILRDLHGRRTVLKQIDEPTVTRRYEEQKSARFELAARVHLRHLLVTPVQEESPFNQTGDDAIGDAAARQKAEDLQRRISGGEDFSTVARQMSEDSSANKGGELGWVEVSQLEPRLAKAALTLPLGNTSEVLQTPLGYHVIQVMDRRGHGVLPYELVRELLYQEVVGEQATYFARSASRDRERLLGEGNYELFPEHLP